MDANDPINHPAHYNRGKIEVIEFIEDQCLPFDLGNAVKYICRHGAKDPGKAIEDLEKARWYLNRRIELLSANRDGRVPLRPNEMHDADEESDPGGCTHMNSTAQIGKGFAQCNDCGFKFSVPV